MDGGQLCVLWLWDVATAPGSSREGAWNPVWAVHAADRLGVGDWLKLGSETWVPEHLGYQSTGIGIWGFFVVDFFLIWQWEGLGCS